MKGYLRKTFEYTAGNTFNKILLLLLLPIFTRFMVPEEYAVYTNITIFISFLSLIYLLGLQQALFSHFYEHKDKQRQFTIITTIIIVITFCGLLFSFLIYNFKTELAQLITTDTAFQDIFIYVSIILFCDVLYAIILRIINTMERAMNYALLSIVKNLALLILIFFGSLAGKFSLRTVFIYMTISSLLSLLLALINIIKILIELKKGSITRPLLFSFPILSDLLKFGLPMIPGTIAFMILRVSDRYMITYLSPNGLYDVGIYAIGYRIGMIISFLTTIVSLVYFPYAMKIAGDPGSSVSYRKMFKAYAICGSILGFLIIFFTWEISTILLDVSYYPAVKIVVFGVLSNFLSGMFNIVNISFYIRKRAGNIVLAVALGAGINILLNFLLITRFGIFGAGIASVIAYLFIFILNFRIAENLYPLKYNVRYVIIGMTAMILISSLNFFFKLIPLLTAFKILILIIAVYYLYFKYIHKHFMDKTLSRFIAEEFRI